MIAWKAGKLCFAASSILLTAALISSISVFTSASATTPGGREKDDTGNSNVEELYDQKDTNIHLVSSVENAQSLILSSPSIWMILFYHPESSQSKEFAAVYKNIGKLCNGIFALAAVDVSTLSGKEIARALQLPNSRFKEDATGKLTTPWIYTMTPSPYDNKNSKPSQVKLPKGKPWLEGMGDLIESMLREQNTVFTKRSIALGLAPEQKEKENTSSKRSSRSSSAPSQVVELTDANFDSLVYQSTDVTAVAFTAPWCGHCTNLKPEWEEAAAKLAGEGVTLGWLDATKHTQVAGVFGVQGFPTIKIFPGGTAKSAESAMDYNGGRTALSIVQHLLKEVDRSGVPKEIPQLTSPQTLQETCGGGHICVLATLPHILESGAAGRNKYRDVLSAVTKGFRGTTFKFLWLEIGAQPELEDALELTFGAPALVAYSMDKQVYAVMRSAFAEKSITSFLHGITTGRQRTVPLNRPNVPKVVATEAWDGLDGAPIEDELSLEDIMGDEL